VPSALVGCVVVGWPDIIYDLTFNRGGDTYTFPVWHIVGRTGTKAARDALSEAVSGVSSVKDGLDGTHDFGSVRVQDATIAEITVGTVPYIGLKFTVEVLS